MLAVVTPTFNRPDGLARLHASLRAQTADMLWLHVIVDDHSQTPVSPELIDADPDRVVILRNAENAGPLASRNTALEAAFARGADLIAFVDDDDYVTPVFFAYVMDMWTRHRTVGWYISRCEIALPAASRGVWPAIDGLYDYFDDMVLAPKFNSDVTHVFTAERVGRARFSSYGRNQREWKFLYQIARHGGLYATDVVTKIIEYRSDGLTLARRGIAPDMPSIINYIEKPAALVVAKPLSAVAWGRFVRQAVRFPARLVKLWAARFGRAALGATGGGKK